MVTAPPELYGAIGRMWSLGSAPAVGLDAPCGPAVNLKTGGSAARTRAGVIPSRDRHLLESPCPAVR
jgi:hypothetical protein